MKKLFSTVTLLSAHADCVKKMQAIGVITKSRRLATVLKNASPSFVERAHSSTLEDLAIQNACERRRFHSAAAAAGCTYRNSSRIEVNYQTHRLFSAEASATENDSSDADTVKGVYDKMLNYVVEKRTAPPNAWLWSLISKCSTHEDIELLFDILQKHRSFRLSNLRIPEGFNSALCREVTKACVHAGALDFGMKTLWKHNLCGLTPDIGSAHHLLLHAKQHNDVKLMTKIMKLVKTNCLPLQSGTADIVFSICYNADRWDLMSKNGKRFVTSGVKLRPSSFELWMEFAAKKGDVESLWNIEKWRSDAMKQHNLSTGFSCAKGFLLEHKPESAAAIIKILYQILSDARKSNIVVELQKLVSEWPLDVVKHKKENIQAFAEALQNDISVLLNALSTLGVDANVNMQEFPGKEALFS